VERRAAAPVNRHPHRAKNSTAHFQAFGNPLQAHRRFLLVRSPVFRIKGYSVPPRLCGGFCPLFFRINAKPFVPSVPFLLYSAPRFSRNLRVKASVCVINMKRFLIITLAAGMLSAVTPALMAQVSTNSPGQSSTLTPDQRVKQREDRKKVLELLALNPKDLKGLTPEDRRAKIKAAADPKIAALKLKKDNGTITADEQADLTLLQNFLHHGGHKTKSDT
jgi:hypothetical protein